MNSETSQITFFFLLRILKPGYKLLNALIILLDYTQNIKLMESFIRLIMSFLNLYLPDFYSFIFNKSVR